ncbi:MAG TPA: hypothetical protein VFF06_15110 [Polyangia bacterium]|nr:hypothetical protein [Polyangia bacterium]
MRSVWGVVALAIAGCATSDQSAYLRWKEGPPSGRLDGKVAVKLVPNLRPAQHGDTDLSDIGRERTAQGQMVGIRLQGDANPRLDYTVGKMTMAALRTAGLGITQPEDPKATAHLTIEIHDFWCDGMLAAKASVGLELVLIDPASGQERLRVPVNATGAAAQCREAFRIALGDVFRGLASAFAEPEVHEAALGPPTTAPPGGEQPQPQ